MWKTSRLGLLYLMKYQIKKQKKLIKNELGKKIIIQYKFIHFGKAGKSV